MVAGQQSGAQHHHDGRQLGLVQYLPFAAGLDSPWWIWVRYLLPMLVLLAPVVALRRRRRTAFMVLGLSGVFVFLAKGLMPPLTSVNMWLYLNAPGFWLFREPMSKLGQVLVIMFGILLALFVEGLIAKVDLARARAPLTRMTSLAGRIPIPLPRPAAIAGARGTPRSGLPSPAGNRGGDPR